MVREVNLRQQSTLPDARILYNGFERVAIHEQLCFQFAVAHAHPSLWTNANACHFTSTMRLISNHLLHLYRRTLETPLTLPAKL